MRRLVSSGVVVGILLCAFGIPAGAQINVGSLRGVVTDPQGGLVVGAQVKVTETATQVIHTAVTDSQGVYTALSLPAGNYDLSVSMAGFETYTYQGVPLASGENRDLDVKLTVGAVSSHVEVTAEAAPDLETREGTYSEGEDTKTLEQLPLEINGAKRDATAYMTALPGFQNGNGFENQVNGSISGYNETYVDGTPEQINAAGHGLTRNFFSAEAVGEIKVVTTPMADLGNVGESQPRLPQNQVRMRSTVPVMVSCETLLWTLRATSSVPAGNKRIIKASMVLAWVGRCGFLTSTMDGIRAFGGLTGDTTSTTIRLRPPFMEFRPPTCRPAILPHT